MFRRLISHSATVCVFPSGAVVATHRTAHYICCTVRLLPPAAIPAGTRGSHKTRGNGDIYTVMRRLTTGYVLRNASLSDFVVVRTSYSVLTQTQTVQYSLLHTYAIWYSLLLLGYKPVQRVTVLNAVSSCNTVVLYYIVL